MSPNSCPGCNAIGPTEFFERRGVPVHVGVQWKSRADARSCTRGDIRFAFCRKCGLIFNTAFDPDLLRYTEGYDNALEYSPTFQAYARTLARHLIEDYAIHGKTIIEIGCGDGSFLKLLCALGDNRGFGFDPSRSGKCDASGSDGLGVQIIADVYSRRCADHKGDLFCCRQVLEHIAAPCEFLSELRESMGDRPEAVLYVEVPDSSDVFLRPYPWLIIYEHCLYFTCASLVRLFESCGFIVQRAGTEYGDQYAFVEACTTRRPGSECHVKRAGLNDLLSAIEAFPAQYRNTVDKWQQRLQELAKAGERMVLWGAGARAVSFTDAVGAADQIPYVVDLNPRKWGRYLSGTGQEIVPPQALRDYGPSIVVVMNEIYRNEIEKHIRSLGLDAQCLCL
jgi:SAM-dependent methyltransferase